PDGRPHHADHRAPPLHGRTRPPDRRARTGPHRRGGLARGTAGPERPVRAPVLPADGPACMNGLAQPPDAIDLGRLKRVLVIKLRHHGDVLLSSPVLSVLKRAAPHVEVDALVYRETAPMLDRHPAISIVHTIDRRLKQRGRLPMLRAELRLWRALRGRRYDLVIHLTEHPRGAWLTRLVGARYAVALDRVDAGVWWRSSFTHLYLLPRHTERHVVEQNLDALRRIGIWPEESDKALVLVPGAAAEACVAALMARHKLARGRFVIMHPGSRWQFK